MEDHPMHWTNNAELSSANVSEKMSTVSIFTFDEQVELIVLSPFLGE